MPADGAACGKRHAKAGSHTSIIANADATAATSADRVAGCRREAATALSAWTSGAAAPESASSSASAMSTATTRETPGSGIVMPTSWFAISIVILLCEMNRNCVCRRHRPAPSGRSDRCWDRRAARRPRPAGRTARGSAGTARTPARSRSAPSRRPRAGGSTCCACPAAARSPARRNRGSPRRSARAAPGRRRTAPGRAARSSR